MNELETILSKATMCNNMWLASDIAKLVNVYHTNISSWLRTNILDNEEFNPFLDYKVLAIKQGERYNRRDFYVNRKVAEYLFSKRPKRFKHNLS